ncbi:MAG: hypothetical protein PSU94_00630 [Lacunisphaera sp.]|nr:hypothetical protein [Lacunisphaera sp.]
MKPLLSVLCLLSSVLCAGATELTDLGQGLGYLRVHALADSVKAAAAPGALVLDLRHASADDAAAAALKTALASRPAAAALFILVSPVTPPVLALIARESSALTLGIAGAQPAPKIVVQTDAATDRRAYEAFEAGIPVDQLISGKIEKERFDEATLVQEFKNGNPDAEIPPAPDPTAPKPEGAPEKPAALTDRVLQRTVHLHHALLALKQR